MGKVFMYLDQMYYPRVPFFKFKTSYPVLLTLHIYLPVC